MDITNLVLYELQLALKYANKTEPSTLTQDDLDKYIKEVKNPIFFKILGWSEEDYKDLEINYKKESELNEKELYNDR